MAGSYAPGTHAPAAGSHGQAYPGAAPASAGAGSARPAAPGLSKTAGPVLRGPFGIAIAGTAGEVLLGVLAALIGTALVVLLFARNVAWRPLQRRRRASPLLATRPLGANLAADTARRGDAALAVRMRVLRSRLRALAAHVHPRAAGAALSRLTHML